ncbi:MAG TPA: hypothetical protein DCZ94_05635 [Lentisphaeria bacterium]|nr:MAG: hypothetical protein A2X48_07155 [Lentisphaerae bacterium GWF2_49_21]HBC86417.1 hypothetical protein [Lentisphaeria bacterium]
MKLLPVGTQRRVRFKLLAKPGSQVFVAGTFNNWNPTANPMKDNPESGHYKAVLRVPPGAHEYKFIVNGVWSVDPKCAARIPNAYGSQNNVLHVKKTTCWDEARESGLRPAGHLPFRKQADRILKDIPLELQGKSIWVDYLRRDRITVAGLGLAVLLLLMLVVTGRV